MFIQPCQIPPVLFFMDYMDVLFGEGNKSKQKSSPDISIKLNRINNRSLDYSRTPNPVKLFLYCKVAVTVVLLCPLYLCMNTRES